MKLLHFRTQRYSTHTKQRGYTNIQLAIGMIVAVLILLGSIAGYKYIDQSKVNNELTILTDLKAATTRYGQFTGTFTSSNMTTAILTGLNFFPNNSTTNQWGGTISAAVGTTSVAGDSIDFTFTNVPTYACKELGTKVDNIASIVTIGSTKTKAAGAASTPLSVTTACATGDNNTIIYTLTQ